MRKNVKKALLFSALIIPIAAAGYLYTSVTTKLKQAEADIAKTSNKLSSCGNERSTLQDKLGMTEAERTKLESSVNAMKQDLVLAQAQKLEAEQRLVELRELTLKFKQLVDAGTLKVKVQDGRMMLALSTDVLFPTASAALSAKGANSIRQVSKLLNGMSTKRFQIEGHTDSIPIHSKKFPSNWELASARAMSVLNTMVSAGFKPNRLSIASYGTTDPIANNKTAKGRAENRRIDIVIVPDLSHLPGMQELEKLTQAPAQAPAQIPSQVAAPEAAPTKMTGAQIAAEGLTDEQVEAQAANEETPAAVAPAQVAEGAPPAVVPSVKN